MRNTVREKSTSLYLKEQTQIYPYSSATAHGTHMLTHKANALPYTQVGAPAELDSGIS